MAFDPYSLQLGLARQVRSDLIDGLRHEYEACLATHRIATGERARLNAMLNSAPRGKGDGASSMLQTAAMRFLELRNDGASDRAMSAVEAKANRLLSDLGASAQFLVASMGNHACPWPDVRTGGPPAAGLPAVRVGAMSPVLPEELTAAFPRLTWEVWFPAFVPFQVGICIVAPANAASMAADAVQSAALRLVLGYRPGELLVRVLDPTGLSIGCGPWGAWPGCLCVQASDVESHLDRLQARVIQATSASVTGIAQDSSPGRTGLAGPVECIAVLNYPAGFSSASLHKIRALARCGPEAGVIVLLHWAKDIKHLVEAGLDSVGGYRATLVAGDNGRFAWMNPELAGWEVRLDGMPDPQVSREIIAPMMAADTRRAERTLSLEDMPAPMSGTESSADCISVSLGQHPDTASPVLLTLGAGLQHHVLMVGGTSSGKTNVMHVVITGLAQRYSPDELKFYLIDFKGGVGFKAYASGRLPHAAVIAVDCDREYGLSVLEALNGKLQQRMSLFKATDAGIEDFASYRKSGRLLDRILLVADEFQDLFAEEDAVAARARDLLGTLLRKGRGFGIHLFLGTQSICGVSLHTVPLQQASVRIAMACSADDSRAVLGLDNPAGAELSRAGQGILNCERRLEANVRFQAFYLPAESRPSRIQAIAARFGKEAWNASVFEGNALPDLSRCEPLRQRLQMRDPDDRPETSPVIWPGEPLAVAPAVSLNLGRIRGRNLLAVLHESDSGTGILLNCAIELLLQGIPVTLLDFTPTSVQRKEVVDAIARVVGTLLEFCPGQAGIQRIKVLSDEIARHAINPAQQPLQRAVVVLGLQHARELRANSQYDRPDINTPAGAFLHLLREGPESGVNTFVWCDLLANVNRCGRSILEEFGLRLGGQLSKQESAEFFKSLDGFQFRKEGRLGLYDDEQPGRATVLRPYAMPGTALIETLAAISKEGELNG